MSGCEQPKPGPRIRCKLCDTTIQSEYRHHFVSCKCRKVSIDGGGVYTRIIGEPTAFDFLDEVKA